MVFKYMVLRTGMSSGMCLGLEFWDENWDEFWDVSGPRGFLESSGLRPSQVLLLVLGGHSNSVRALVFA